MPIEDLDAWLARSFEDWKLSRSERQALVASPFGSGPPEARMATIRRAFAAARGALPGADPVEVLAWLEEVVAALRERGEPPTTIPRAEAYFSPGDDCPRAILRLLDQARSTVDACVFTITDDRLADGLIAAARRGLEVRVITDDAKADDLGSDASRLNRSGIDLRIDRSPFHMHHKFAIVDRSILLTGSYNWTRGAANDNEENLIISDDARWLAPFLETFDRLWRKFA
ncbi:phospholipase D-like domain-containing protein [Tundrisphaera sp. TA3]|uniref:phospholipase D-like domain-containing protein n=1 Tax=Tundrisphaera sp. TA3 TaxID=3435775 RepID=UPI003EBE1D61